MKKIGMRKITGNAVGIVLALICLIYPLLALKEGFFKWQFQNTDYKMMLLELAIWFVIALLGIKKANILWLVAELSIFTYLHMMFLPAVVAVIYAIITKEVGKAICRLYIEKEEKNSTIIAYFSGLMVLTILYAILSLFEIGSIKATVILNVILLILVSINRLKKFSCSRFDKAGIKKYQVSATEYLISAAIMCFLMCAIGRANASLDYDSVWYGLRSAFVLDNQNGIYDNLKLVGCVYTYAKGLETYLLPVSGTDSYGFFYAANILFGCLILLMVYKICRIFLTRKQALAGAMLTAAVPGVMNMTITAKTDIITLLIQLMCVYFGLCYILEKKKIYLGMVIATYIYSQTLKPTAALFSTSIMLAFIFVCLCYRIKISIDKKSSVLISISIIDLLFIWMRTYRLTGIPATSIWAIIFRKLGFVDKYPYSSGQVSQFRAGNIFSRDVADATVRRIWEFCFDPRSSDMNHVIIAWGTTLCTFLIIIVCIAGIFNIRFFYNKLKVSAAYGFIGLLLVGEIFGCFLSLWLLKKPDGNYFMLYYTITVIAGTIFIFKYTINYKRTGAVIFNAIIVGFVIENIVITGAVNWAWVSKFSDINWLNKGYYNHRGEFQTLMNERGCNKIYDIMCSDPHNKVLAFGTHPEVERFPCIIESEIDVDYWGNHKLLKNIEEFKRFIKYEEYKYIYIEPGYLQENDNYSNYIELLLEQGMIKQVYEENGYILLEL